MSIEIPPSGSRGDKMPGAAVAVMGLLPAVYRLFGGRGMGRTVILTTVGAKTGKQRNAHLMSFKEGDGWLVVASKGGDPKHPAWYLNLAHNPDQVWLQVGSKRMKVRPEVVKDDARAKAWKRIVSEYSNYGGYEKKTDREIPVVRLTPIA
jgi:deazaflavin-dependent oxidoreductase (nitroreductase family)